MISNFSGVGGKKKAEHREDEWRDGKDCWIWKRSKGMFWSTQLSLFIVSFQFQCDTSAHTHLTFIFCRLMERRNPSETSLMTHGVVGRYQKLTAKREVADMCAIGVVLTLTMWRLVQRLRKNGRYLADRLVWFHISNNSWYLTFFHIILKKKVSKFPQKAELCLTLIMVRNVFKHQMNTLKWFLKDNLTMKTGVMAAEMQLCQHRNKLCFKLY